MLGPIFGEALLTAIVIKLAAGAALKARCSFLLLLFFCNRDMTFSMIQLAASSPARTSPRRNSTNAAMYRSPVRPLFLQTDECFGIRNVGERVRSEMNTLESAISCDHVVDLVSQHPLPRWEAY